MQKGFFKKKVAMCAAMTLIGCMLLGSTSMAATSYSFSVKKGEYGYSGSGKKTEAGDTFSINVTSYDAYGKFFICPIEGGRPIGTDITIKGKVTDEKGSYYESVSDVSYTHQTLPTNSLV